MNRLTVLLTNIILHGRSGTEIMIRDIALALQRRGHAPIVYSPSHGALAAELRSVSIPVVQDLANVQVPVDIIHGHHLPTMLTACAFFPQAPALFFCHDYIAWHDAPPHLPSIRRYVAVDRTCFDRLTVESGISLEKARILLNPVDIDRFKPGPPLNERPRSALAFAKNHAHVDVIRAVCRYRGLEVRFIGPAVGQTVDQPEAILPDHDIVFASALSAMEAMACGRALVVCDGRGLAGFCTRDRYADWRALNFGLRTLRKPLGFAEINAALDDYDPREASLVSEQLRAEGGMPAYVEKLESLYAEAIASSGVEAVSEPALLRSIGSEVQSIYATLVGGPGWMRERQALLDTIDKLHFGSEAVPVGRLLRFSADEGPQFWRAVSGFSSPEDWGVWTVGETASMMLRLPSGDDFYLRFRLLPFLPDNAGRCFSVEVSCGGAKLATWRFQDPAEGERSVVIPKALVTADGSICLAFRIEAPRSPQELGLSNDKRPLGLGFLSLFAEMKPAQHATKTAPSAEHPRRRGAKTWLRELAKSLSIGRRR